MKYNNPGINYSLDLPMSNGKIPNKDEKTNIRYGVINQNEVLNAWCDSSEAEYPCHECEAFENDECTELMCECEPIAFNVVDDEYTMTAGSDGDIFIIKSPYYTYAQFCSPCAPGACYLVNPVSPENTNNKCYCLDNEWFDDCQCPYPYWRVDTDELVYQPEETNG